MNNKYIFLGDSNSINAELIFKSFYQIKDKVKYIIICNINDLKSYQNKFNIKIEINELNNPLTFDNLNTNKINCFNLTPSTNNLNNMLAQINLCNQICNLKGYDLVTMPINKYTFKKKLSFNGMTEYLGLLNRKKTLMLMVGENFSIIPITTHINLKDIGDKFEIKLSQFFKSLKSIMKNFDYLDCYDQYNFLCFNPHCGENGTIGNEDIKINKYLSKFKKFKFNLIPADSAFNRVKKNSLYVSFYHDQALIPFKILNKKSLNQTLGLNYRRLSPSHGTAEDIKFRNIADNTSYVQCMTI